MAFPPKHTGISPALDTLRIAMDSSSQLLESVEKEIEEAKKPKILKYIDNLKEKKRKQEEEKIKKTSSGFLFKYLLKEQTKKIKKEEMIGRI